VHECQQFTPTCKCALSPRLKFAKICAAYVSGVNSKQNHAEWVNTRTSVGRLSNRQMNPPWMIFMP
jgi:hypothetical protein